MEVTADDDDDGDLVHEKLYDPAEIDALLHELSCQFFQMVPVRRMKWKSSICDGTMLGCEVQQRILAVTVRNDRCNKYPPALNYQKTFMKQFVNLLESLSVDIADEVYEVYTGLLRREEEEDDTLCYKTYQLEPGSEIHLQESVYLVCEGTTGLSTWQAAQHLAEWCLENPSLFENKNILELGSGLGLTGSVICKACSPSNYYFTDCHSQVLFLLAKNIQENFATNTKPDTDYPLSPSRAKHANIIKKIRRQLSLSSETMITEFGEISICPTSPPPATNEDVVTEIGELSLSTTHWVKENTDLLGTLRHDSRVHIAMLNWCSVNDAVLSHISPDIILGADVVFDVAIIPFLVSLLKNLLTSYNTDNKPRVAYISSTIRNEVTRDQFLYDIGAAGLAYKILPAPSRADFHYDKTVPIEILQISQATHSISPKEKIAGM